MDLTAGHLEATELDDLLRLRLVVARVGEMDVARWWNTKGQLGALGASVLQRGFPRTHWFAQARSVFAAARQQCEETYGPKNAVTLWRLPSSLEDEFELRWEQWLDDAESWSPFFKDLDGCTTDLTHELRQRDLVTDDQVDRASKLRRSAESRAVQVSGEFTGSTDDLAVLALAFGRGEPGSLAVPYQAWSGDS